MSWEEQLFELLMGEVLNPDLVRKDWKTASKILFFLMEAFWSSGVFMILQKTSANVAASCTAHFQVMTQMKNLENVISTLDTK